jgi:Flp pilus assembly pilin Flp
VALPPPPPAPITVTIIKFVAVCFVKVPLVDISVYFIKLPELVLDITNDVVAIWVLLSPVAAVGAVGVPVNAGLFTGANKSVLVVTYAVVASLVVLSLLACVGALGDPIKVGLSNGANPTTEFVLIALPVSVVSITVLFALVNAI